MQNQLALKKAAIEAARSADWPQAVTINQDILVHHPQDVEALNRLGLAYLRLGEDKKAKEAFKQVIAFDAANIIANKHLSKLKNNEVTTDIIFDNSNDFIEEPGKSKVVVLHRLTDKNRLNSLKVGQICQLQSKNRYISVVDDKGKHIGTLPDDISFRLCRLIQAGNEYRTIIYKVSDKQCYVQVKETKRSKKNEQFVSFPIRGQNAMLLPDDFILEEDIPFEVIDEYSEEDEQSALDLEKINKKSV